MSRIFIDEAVKHEPLDFTIEYRKIHDLFYKGGLYKYHRENFQEGYLDRRSLTFKEFNQKHNFVFNRNIENVTEDELIRFCEYVYNMCHKWICRSGWEFGLAEYSGRVESHIFRLVEDMNYKIIKNDTWDLIVLKDYKLNVIESSNSIKRSMKYAIAEYRSINIRGNLDAKKSILSDIAYELEQHKSVLKDFNAKFTDNLFMFLNNGNIRHNNESPSSKKYSERLMSLSNKEYEQFYDHVYEMCLYALSILEYVHNIEKTKEYKEICTPTTK